MSRSVPKGALTKCLRPLRGLRHFSRAPRGSAPGPRLTPSTVSRPGAIPPRPRLHPCAGGRTREGFQDSHDAR
jgi:hypothetical protein